MVTTDDSGVVVIVFRGPQNGDSVRRVKEQGFAQLEKLRAQGKKTLVLVDITALKLSAKDSAGRAEAKKMLNLEYEAAAIVGPSHFGLFMSYLLRGLSRSQHVRFFSNERQARKWLMQTDHTAITASSSIRHMGRVGWLFVIVLLLVQIATFVMWQQAISRNKTESQQAFAANNEEIKHATEIRLQAYTDALRGFKGLFNSSDFVSKNDFTSYYNSLDLQKNYPGLRSLGFISAVEEENLNVFVADMRAAGLTVADGSPFTIKSKTNEQLHFIVTYLATSNNPPNIGLDIGSIAGRQQIYSSALASDEIFASGLLDLPATPDQPAQKGFFITTPVYSALNPERKIGIVNAVFNYHDFFNNLFTESHILRNVTLRFVDPDSGVTIHSSNNNATGDLKLTETMTIPVANRTWKLIVQANSTYGISASQVRTPISTLIAGQIITLFLIIVFLLLWRARHQALELADTITQDLRHERDLAVTNDRKTHAILSSIGDGVFVVNRAGVIVLFNKAAEIISGFSADQALGRHYKKILAFSSEKDNSTVDSFINAALKGKHAEMARHTLLKRKDGGSIPVADSAAPVINAHSRIEGAVIVFRDISRERQLEKSKDEFLSIASHELRTPMGAVRANTSMILDGDYGSVNKGLVEPLNDIHDSTVRLVNLVNDLLSAARIEAGRMKFVIEDFDVEKLIKSTTANLKPLAAEKGIKLKLAPDITKAKVQADQSKLSQVITNLLGNALKFTDSGSITIAAQKRDDMLEVSVTDTGIGISAADQRKLFGKFSQVGSQESGKPAGTGLGLYISRQIIRKMGGDLRLQASEPGKGSRFAFTIPLANTAAAQKTERLLKREATAHPDQK